MPLFSQKNMNKEKVAFELIQALSRLSLFTGRTILTLLPPRSYHSLSPLPGRIILHQQLSRLTRDQGLEKPVHKPSERPTLNRLEDRGTTRVMKQDLAEIQNEMMQNKNKT